MTTEIYEYFLPSLPIHSGYCRTSRSQVFTKTLFWIFPKTHRKTHVLESLLINLHISSAYIFIEIETSAKEFSLEFYEVFRKLFCRTPLVGCILHSKIWNSEPQRKCLNLFCTDWYFPELFFASWNREAFNLAG